MVPGERRCWSPDGRGVGIIIWWVCWLWNIRRIVCCRLHVPIEKRVNVAQVGVVWGVVWCHNC